MLKTWNVRDNERMAKRLDLSRLADRIARDLFGVAKFVDDVSTLYEDAQRGLHQATEFYGHKP